MLSGDISYLLTCFINVNLFKLKNKTCINKKPSAVNFKTIKIKILIQNTIILMFILIFIFNDEIYVIIFLTNFINSPFLCYCGTLYCIFMVVLVKRATNECELHGCKNLNLGEEMVWCPLYVDYGFDSQYWQKWVKIRVHINFIFLKIILF